MTTEMGPRDVDLSLSERFAAHGTRYTTRLLSSSGDDVSLRFTPSTATLSVSGESEHSGDVYRRGILVSLLYMINLLFAGLVGSVSLNTVDLASSVGPWLVLAVSVPALFVTCAALLFAFGSIGLLTETDVVDHTTEPAPDAVDELKDRYVAGDLDDAEFEREAAEVWER